MRILVNSQFPQHRLFDSAYFSRFLTNLGTRLHESQLEYLDKKGILRPVLRLHNPVNYNTPNDTWIIDNHLIKNVYTKAGLVEFPKDNDFKPWKSYRQGHHEKVKLFYHPFQFICVNNIANLNNTLTPALVEHILEPSKFVKDLKDRLMTSLSINIETYKTVWIQRIGLLMLLEEAYAPLVRGFSRSGLFGSDKSFFQWRRWRIKEFKPIQVLELSGYTIEEAKQLYDTLAFDGITVDPLSDWFVFLKYVKRSSKFMLKGDALRAQYYYELASMMRHFIYDLTKEKMPEPDELTDVTWKDRVFANKVKHKKFRYENPTIRKTVLDDFLTETFVSLAIIYEGKTEEYAITSILKALNVSLDKDGLQLINTEGSNLERRLEGYSIFAKRNGVRIFLIVDKDKESIVRKHLRKGTIEKSMYKVWRDDFESDNFGINEVLDEINKSVLAKGFNPILKSEVIHKTEKNRSFMNVVSGEFYYKNKREFDKVMSKVDIIRPFIDDRVKEIKLEYTKNGWEPRLPIEKVMNRIFDKLPPYRL